jgi:hypothetical protein
MRFAIKRQLVERGFFPVYLADVAKDSKKLHAEISEPLGDLGFYFEVSGLPKGEHELDFWLMMAKEDILDCPEMVRIKAL